MKISYDPNTLILAASWVSSSTCTAGRVTAAIAASAGLRRVDCALKNHPGADVGPAVLTGLDAAVGGAMEALKGL